MAGSCLLKRPLVVCGPRRPLWVTTTVALFPDAGTLLQHVRRRISPPKDRWERSMQLKNQSRRVSAVRRFIPPLYGSLCYGFFLATFLYAIGFTTNLVVPTSVDVGTMSPPISAVLIDVALLAVFSVRHSLIAREGIKRRWSQIIPKAIERTGTGARSQCSGGL